MSQPSRQPSPHSGIALITLCLSLQLTGCGELEAVESINQYNPEVFSAVIEPIFNSFSQSAMPCELCHKNLVGGFKWDPSGTPAASSDNILYVQRAINPDSPPSSRLLTRLTPPNSNHPLYFCPTDTYYLQLIAWIGGETNIDTLKGIMGTAPKGPLTECP